MGYNVHDVLKKEYFIIKKTYKIFKYFFGYDVKLLSF
jgi:hypothetical protein